MKKTIIDAQNHPCPKPIMMTKQAVDAAEPETEIIVLLNRESAKNNTITFLEGNNIPVSYKQDGELFTLSIIKPKENRSTTDVPDNACSIAGCDK
ncbi:MAG: sulfurtransferase TusA family protein [Kiritimatiellae bacterium]|nr:sulfurtransferase TusA family protein [Kiritimatiellia bacterium]